MFLWRGSIIHRYGAMEGSGNLEMCMHFGREVNFWGHRWC